MARHGKDPDTSDFNNYCSIPTCPDDRYRYGAPSRGVCTGCRAHVQRSLLTKVATMSPFRQAGERQEKQGQIARTTEAINDSRKEKGALKKLASQNDRGAFVPGDAPEVGVGGSTTTLGESSATGFHSSTRQSYASSSSETLPVSASSTGHTNRDGLRRHLVDRTIHPPSGHSLTDTSGSTSNLRAPPRSAWPGERRAALEQRAHPPVYETGRQRLHDVPDHEPQRPQRLAPRSYHREYEQHHDPRPTTIFSEHGLSSLIHTSDSYNINPPVNPAMPRRPQAVACFDASRYAIVDGNININQGPVPSHINGSLPRSNYRAMAYQDIPSTGQGHIAVEGPVQVRHPNNRGHSIIGQRHRNSTGPTVSFQRSPTPENAFDPAPSNDGNGEDEEDEGFQHYFPNGPHTATWRYCKD